MPLRISGRSVSERSQGRSSQVSGLPKICAQCSDGGLRVLLRGAVEPGAEHRIGGVVGQAVPAQLREVAGRQVAGAPAGDPGVQGDDDALEAGLLGAADQALRQVPVGRGVELEEAGGLAELGGDLLHRVDGERRRDHRHPGAGGGPGGRQVAVPVLRAQADHPDRGHEQRVRAASCRTARPTGHARAAPTSIRGTSPQPRERGDVGPLGVLVAGAARDVRPHRGRQHGLGPGLQLRRSPSGSAGTTPPSPSR